MTAEIYLKNPTIKEHLRKATVAIPQKDDKDNKNRITGYKPYITKDGLFDAAAQNWPLPSAETHEMRIITSQHFELVKDLIIVVTKSEMQFRPHGSTEESHWSTYRDNIGSAFMEKTNREGGTYLVDDAPEKSHTGAVVRVIQESGIGTAADPADMPAQSQQRSAPQQQAAATQQKAPPRNFWPEPYHTLTPNERKAAHDWMMKEYGLVQKKLEDLIGKQIAKNPDVTAQEINDAAAETV